MNKSQFIIGIIVTFLTLVAFATKSHCQAQPTQEIHYCGATTNAGTPCKQKVKEQGAKCRHHDPTTPRCGYMKSDGKPCRMPVKQQGGKCHHHKAPNTIGTKLT